MLPVELPDIADYSPVLFDQDDPDSEPSPPLNKAGEWVDLELDLGDGLQTYRRDTNVMPQWAGSSWYELRYADPHNPDQFCAKENEAYWMGPRPDEHGPRDPGEWTSTSAVSSTPCCICSIRVSGIRSSTTLVM